MPPRRLLLLSADWQTRALLLVSLKELGYAVLALPGLRWGLKAVLQEQVEPPLVFVDTKDDAEATPDALHHLRELIPDVPFLILTEAWYQASYAPLRGEVTALLARPLLIQELVDTIRRLLPPASTSD
jgi:DNA-binding NtrC family response regulator